MYLQILPSPGAPPLPAFSVLHHAVGAPSFAEKRAFVSCASEQRVGFDTAGECLFRNGDRLYLNCTSPAGVCVIAEVDEGSFCRGGGCSSLFAGDWDEVGCGALQA